MKLVRIIPLIKFNNRVEAYIDPKIKKYGLIDFLNIKIPPININIINGKYIINKYKGKLVLFIRNTICKLRICSIKKHIPPIKNIFLLKLNKNKSPSKPKIKAKYIKGCLYKRIINNIINISVGIALNIFLIL